MNISVVGLDLAKETFHVACLDDKGKLVKKRKLSRAKLFPFFSKLTFCTVAMEGCASSHYWSRTLKQLGHTVKILPAQHVKAYVRGNKNDFNDALAIAEASRVPEMRTVAPKTIEQQSIQALHRMRRSSVADRTAVSNQVRGFLAEFGIVFPKGINVLKKRLPEILEDAENDLHYSLRMGLSLKLEQLLHLDGVIDRLTTEITCESKRHVEIKRLQSIPGYGPIVASCFYSEFGNGSAFKKGRDLSAALGVVPKQHSTGGRHRLLGISKRGNKYLRSLLIHGARSVVNASTKKNDPLSLWIQRLVERRGKNRATVALANKLARVGWAVLTTGKTYQTGYATA